ncbi:MAG: GNAT family N-acetyltransferase [Aquirhabdus sp.]
MKIQSSTLHDVSVFRDFWNAALDYQKAKQLPLWPNYPEEQINHEIRAGLHFSAYLPDGTLVGYFSIALSDAIIWGEREQGNAIYIHRMCVNPCCKGSQLAASVLVWGNEYVSSIGRKLIRMDTWADNAKLVNYYKQCGFHYIGDKQLGEVSELPPHYNNTKLALFENCMSD